MNLQQNAVVDEKKEGSVSSSDGGGGLGERKPMVANFESGEIYPTNYPEKTYEDYVMRNDVESKGYQVSGGG
jgi:hypothetical protein